MDDTVSMCGGEGARDLDGQRERVFGCVPAARDQQVEALPIDVLHDDESVAVRLIEPVHGADIRMVEHGYGLRLFGELPFCPLAVRELTRQKLQRHLAPAGRVFCQVDTAHSAPAEKAFNFEDADCPAR